jgi:hypothetical protein
LKELFEISFTPVNAFLSIVCILMLLYWVLVIVTGLDADYFSIDFHGDAHFHIGADFDTDAHHSIDAHTSQGKDVPADAEPSTFINLLKFFNFDELPLMFMLTIIFFVMWFISINITHYFSINSIGLGVLLLIPNFIVSLFVVKLVAHPLGYLYKQINHKGEEDIDFIGRRCTVVSSVRQDKIGQVELFVNGDSIKIYAKSNTGEELQVGQHAVIVNESTEKKYYLIEKFDY